jgi:protein-S-isoprenylcysteine O-methyltransferase Ste14
MLGIPRRGAAGVAAAVLVMLLFFPGLVRNLPQVGLMAILWMFAVVWALLFVIPLVLYTQVRVIMPEERYLQRAFGDAYHTYCSCVRRWL